MLIFIFVDEKDEDDFYMSGFRRRKSPLNPTYSPIQKVLPKIFKNINEVYRVDNPDVYAAFVEIIGSKWAKMCDVQNFVNDVLFVKVHHATLYSILMQEINGALIEKLRRKIPTVKVKKIVLRR